jgi:hypothetical protein
MITSCSFGKITINKKIYTSDLIIYSDGTIEDGWRRIAGHRLSNDDIVRLVKSEPKIIIAGTGVSGMMKPDESLIRLLDKKNIIFFAKPNQQAVKLYNRFFMEKRTGACFHLTC